MIVVDGKLTFEIWHGVNGVDLLISKIFSISWPYKLSLKIKTKVCGTYMLRISHTLYFPSNIAELFIIYKNI